MRILRAGNLLGKDASCLDRDSSRSSRRPSATSCPTSSRSLFFESFAHFFRAATFSARLSGTDLHPHILECSRCHSARSAMVGFFGMGCSLCHSALSLCFVVTTSHREAGAAFACTRPSHKVRPPSRESVSLPRSRAPAAPRILVPFSSFSPTRRLAGQSRPVPPKV